MSKFLIVGLGNIGEEYEGTRHNIGFEIVEKLASDANVIFKNDRYAMVAEMKYKGKTLVLIKPTTYMNLSGKAVNYWMQQEKINIDNMLVIVDELALPFGKIRLGPKGSDGGHNGLKHIQETLSTSNYPRLRFGIGNEFGKGYQVNYVLGKWNEEEKKTLNQRVEIATNAIKTVVFAGLQRSMNEFNTK